MRQHLYRMMGAIGAGTVNLQQAERGMWPMHDEMSLADMVVFFGHLADLGYAIFRWVLCTCRGAPGWLCARHAAYLSAR